MGLFLLFQGPLLLYIVFIYTLVKKAGALSPDGQALVNFRTNIVSSNGVILQWRPEDPDPCGWKGVTCDPKSKRVTSLYLQGNYLSEAVPYELGNLMELLNLDISSNSLSGNIPPSLGELEKLQNFNVSTNFLVGLIPSDGILDKFTRDSFVGNRGLCGKQVNVICKDAGNPTNSHSLASAQNQDGKKKYSGRLLISTSATIGALLLVALVCFWGCFLYKKLGKSDGIGLAIIVIKASPKRRLGAA